VTDHEFETNQEQAEVVVIEAGAAFSSDSLALFLAELARYPVGCTNSMLLQIRTSGVTTELMHPTRSSTNGSRSARP